jgi:hypothetical protein
MKQIRKAKKMVEKKQLVKQDTGPSVVPDRLGGHCTVEAISAPDGDAGV